MRFLRKHLPCCAVVALYVLCILIANPKGEFPLNDDWSYARSAFAFGSGHGLKVDEWVAPSLLGQALYGGLLARFFSPSFLVLRLSTLALSCGTAVLIWATFLRAGFPRDLALILLVAWVFNPLQFCLSFTYMTEIPFLFFVAVSGYLFVLYLDRPSTGLLVLCAASLGYAFLIRQTALVFLLALACGVICRSRLRQTLPAAAVAAGFIAAYGLWLLARGSSPLALHRKFELLPSVTARQIAGNSYGMLFYLAFMLAPVWLFLIPSLWRRARSVRPVPRIGVAVAWSACVAAGLGWFAAHCLHAEYLPSSAYHARMPFLLNVLYDTGLGPITLDPAYFGPPPTPIHPRVWIAVTAVVALGALACGLLCVFGLIQRRPYRKPLLVFAGLAFLGLALVETVFSHLQEGGLFDRHVLIVAFPFCLLLGLFSGETAGEGSEGRARIPALCAAAVAVAVLGAFSVAATHDYMQWNRIRWDMGRRLLERGVDPLSIVGGFEFNAWYNYDTFLARGNIAGVHRWWFDRRDYVISMSPQAGYEVLEKKEYFSWVHRRPVALYVIRRSALTESGPGKIAHKQHEELDVLQEVQNDPVGTEEHLRAPGAAPE